MEPAAVDALTLLPRLEEKELVLQTWKGCKLKGSTGTAMVTTRRLVFWSGTVGQQVSLSRVTGVAVNKPRWDRWSHVDVSLGGGKISLVVTEGNEVYKCLESARAQFEEEVSKKSADAAAFSTSSAGIGGILRNERRKREAAGQLADEVQSDLTALIRQASRVVDMLQRYQAREGGAVSTAGLRSLGLGGGLWAEGTDDHEVLARRVASFAVTTYFPWLADDAADTNPAQCAAAMVSLPDVYCHFNRARGIARLVSPDDFATALEVFLSPKSEARLREAPIEIRTFRSGVKVLRPTRRADEALRVALLTLAQAHPSGLADVQAADLLHVPAALARLHLEDVEEYGVLCRDDAPAGLRFFPNHFLETAPV